MLKFVRYFTVLATLLLMGSVAAEDKKESPAAECKYKATLLWGTDGSKPDDPNLKDVDSHFREKLKKVFKWHNYYEVKNESFSIKPGEKKRFKLSDKCELEVEHSATEGMIVELIGEGKPVKKVKQSMPLTDWLVVGGDDKNATAWFVVIRPE
jgi:hypothetical protein